MPGHRYLPGQNVIGLICPLCDLLLRDAVQTFRGIRVCKSCFEARLVRIPVQFTSESGQYFVDRAARREVADLLIQCDYCNWIGQVALQEEHNREHCNSEVVQLPQFHSFRAYYGDHEPVHTHTAMGHDNPVARRALEPHESQQYQWAEETLTQGSTSASSASQLQMAVQEQQVDATWELALMISRHHLQPPNTNSQQLQPAIMHLEQRALQEPLQNSDQVSITREFEEGHMSGELATGSHRSLHQIQRPNVMHLLQNLREITNSTEARVSQLERKLEEMERQRAMMMVRISELERQLQASLTSTRNGSFLWRIPDISRWRRDAIEARITSIYSPPFYTGRNGYKMCIRVYLNGDGTGLTAHLSIFLVLMKGEYDPLLKWPVESKVSLILVDQNHRKHIIQTFKPTPESSSFQRPHSNMNVASGCPQFARLTVLEDENYVKDNVMYIKCIIDTSSIVHP